MAGKVAAISHSMNGFHVLLSQSNPAGTHLLCRALFLWHFFCRLTPTEAGATAVVDDHYGLYAGDIKAFRFP